MSWRSVACAATLLTSVGLAVPTAASAQGLFQSLFGWGSPQQPPAPQVAPAPGFGHRAPAYNPYNDRARDPADGQRDRGGRYRTLCVRLCDGYYWPISNATGRTGFYRDANICRTSCGEDVRLFHQPAGSGEAESMVDNQGRLYTSLPNAFRHRKEYVQGCRCKAEPWTEAEENRHRRYALEEMDQQARRERVAKAQTDTSEPDDADRIPSQEAAESQLPPLTPAVVATTIGEPTPSAGDRDDRPLPPRDRIAETTRDAKSHIRREATKKRSRPAVVLQSPRRNSAVASAPYGLGLAATKRWPGD
jgi:hypothetical protein